ncbi:Fe2+-dependent dioxygenase [Luteimonas soli]|uniref:Fe2+-dependent dioxygenase n=1 Tax=Luteimonas soli TaxID=1648966 RepID=A0ABV7XNS3_9GAMM
MLLHVPAILDAAQIAHLRKALDGGEWIDGKATVGAQGAQVKRNQQLADGSPLARELGAAVLAALAASPLYHSAVLPLRTLPPRFNRYQGGGTYGLHVDGSVMHVAVPGQPPGTLRTDVSCTLFLCEPDEYDGGELVIHDTYGEHEVKLPAGDLVIYPSSSLHRVEPVTRGARLASFFWVQSLIRDDSQRRILFELDASIQSLTQAGADRAALLQLTGVYHNLLRQWAET